MGTYLSESKLCCTTLALMQKIKISELVHSFFRTVHIKFPKDFRMAVCKPQRNLGTKVSAATLVLTQTQMYFYF